jgi:hypothetical protein
MYLISTATIQACASADALDLLLTESSSYSRLIVRMAAARVFDRVRALEAAKALAQGEAGRQEAQRQIEQLLRAAERPTVSVGGYTTNWDKAMRFKGGKLAFVPLVPNATFERRIGGSLATPPPAARSGPISNVS